MNWLYVADLEVGISLYDGQCPLLRLKQLVKMALKFRLLLDDLNQWNNGYINANLMLTLQLCESESVNWSCSLI